RIVTGVQTYALPIYTLFYQHLIRYYSSNLDINATNSTCGDCFNNIFPSYLRRSMLQTTSTWDELIELMYLLFLVKRSYAGIYRLFRTFVGAGQLPLKMNCLSNSASLRRPHPLPNIFWCCVFPILLDAGFKYFSS